MRLFIRLAFLFCLYLLISGTRSNAQTARIYVDNRLIPQGDTVRLCAGNSLTFKHNTATISPIEWKFPNGVPSTSSSAGPFNVIYSTKGVFIVKQIVGSGNNADSSIIYVDVSD